MLETVRPYARFLGFPLAVTLPVCFLVWLILGEPGDPVVPVVAAVLVLPNLWLGVVFAILLSVYLRAAAQLTHANDVINADRARAALHRLGTQYRFRERLARGPFRNSVYIGYVLKSLQLSARSTGHPLNAYRAVPEERTQEFRRQQRQTFAALCRLVVGVGSKNEHDTADTEEVEDYVRRLPFTNDAARNKATSAASATFMDGDGFLSTLTCLTYLHFAASLPLEMRDQFELALDSAGFDPARYGWLSTRVVETVVYTLVEHQRPATEALALLNPELTRITAELTASTSARERQASKWTGRARLMNLSGPRALQ